MRQSRRCRLWRFDDSGSMGYFFIYDQQGVNVMHAANPALQGRNLMDLKDPNGVEVIRGLWNAALVKKAAVAALMLTPIRITRELSQLT